MLLLCQNKPNNIHVSILHVHVLVCCSLRQKCRKFMQLSIQKLTGIDNLGEELTLNFLVQCNALYPGL